MSQRCRITWSNASLVVLPKKVGSYDRRVGRAQAAAIYATQHHRHKAHHEDDSLSPTSPTTIHPRPGEAPIPRVHFKKLHIILHKRRPHHGRLRLLQPQPQHGPPCPGYPTTKGYQYRNNHCRLSLQWRCCNCSRHKSHKWTHSSRQGRLDTQLTTWRPI